MSAVGGDSNLVVEQVDEHVVTVGFNNPESLNALDNDTADELDAVLAAHSRTPTILILHSTTPGVFISGADIRELRDRGADDALASINAGLFNRLAAHRWPTIAAVDGYALGGGCELALACDLRIATPGSTFGQPELGLGILAGAGANWRLQELVGLPTARRMLYLGERLNAEAALEVDLIDAVSTPEALLENAIAMAHKVGRNSWRAIELTKLALRQHQPSTTSFDIAAQALLFESDDKRERMDKFLNRKKKS